MELYRRSFKPSKVLQEPYAMVGVNVIAADTDEEANRLATTLQQQFLNLIRGNEVPLQPPVADINDIASAYEQAALQQQLGSSIVGSRETVEAKLQKFLDETQADEMMVIAQIFDHQARLRSYEIVTDIIKGNAKQL
jgi:alkanesulfonate monooxygenase SsuD/methylene tetrahydromethanopterin reductase-like flavin-dependent oxidoreductase (luciferase family)